MAETPTLPALQATSQSAESNGQQQEQIQEALEERDTVATHQLNLERSGGRGTSSRISQTQATVKNTDKSDINHSQAGDNQEFRETVMLDDNFQQNKIRLQKQVSRPVSNHSVASTSTNRYGGNLGAGYASNGKSQAPAGKSHHNPSAPKRSEYEQFDDDEEDEELPAASNQAASTFATLSKKHASDIAHEQP